jgi:23S rRNA pseudouridine2605 synthase/23S rRNA pseudouridine2604 synthase
MVLKEGRNRQIRRMVRKVGSHVTDLKRVRVANIRLGDLPEGGWRHLTAAERKGLLAVAGGGPGKKRQTGR